MKPTITLIFPSSSFLLNQRVFPPLGIMYLSAFLKQRGFTVQCLDMALGHTPEMVEAKFVGISITTPQRDEAYRLAAYLKKLDKILIAGGPHATHMPDECKEHGFDYVIRGYGEWKLSLLLGGDFTEPDHIDKYPFPDRDALPIRNYKYQINGRPATVIMTSRGCPFHCSYCARIDRKFYLQSAERTIREVMHIATCYGFKAFMIFDDIFVANKKRLKKLADVFELCDFLFRCFARSNLLDDTVCRLLKQMGVVEVGIGIESGSDQILKRNMKGTSVSSNTRAIKNLHKYGIRAKCFLIVGLPGETHYTVKETMDWIRQAEPDDIDVNIFQPLPGSRIFANPNKWGIKFNYNSMPMWYKGTPEKYETSVETEGLKSKEILEYRWLIEKEFKKPNLLK